MLIERLVFKDFMTFLGEQAVDFSTEEGSVTVLLAPNNTGKTNTIHSIRFLLYGESQKVDTLPCEAYWKAPQSAEEEELVSYVEAIVRVGESRYRVRREIQFSVNKDKIVLHRSQSLLTCYEIKSDHDKQIDAPQSLVERWIPREMFNFYYFAGEELQGQLFRVNRQNAVPENLQKLLYRSEWESLAKNLKKLSAKFARDGQADVERRESWGQLLNEIEKGDERIGEHEKKIADLEAAAEEQNRLYHDADKRVGELASHGSSKVSEQLKQVTEKLAAAERSVTTLETWSVLGTGEVAKAIAASRLGPALEVMAEQREKRVFPADVSETILAEIVERSLCICERECLPGTPELEAIQSLRKRSLSENIQNSLSAVERLVTPDRDGNVFDIAKALVGTLDEREGRYRSALANQDELEKEKKRLEDAYSPDQEKHHRDALVTRERHKAKEIQIRADLQAEVTTLSREQARKVNLTRQKSKPGTRPVASVPHLGKAQAVADRFEDIADRCRDAIHRRMKELLQKELAQIYSNIATDHSEGVIDKNTLLPRIERHGARLEKPGGGQEAVLALAFLVALARCRKTVNDELREQFHITGVQEQGFFMDSVFAPMDLGYQSQIIQHIPKYMPQLVMLFANQQWNSGAEETQGVLKEYGARYYSMTLHTNQKVELKNYEYTYKGDTLLLLEKLKPSEGEHPFATIEALE